MKLYKMQQQTNNFLDQGKRKLPDPMASTFDKVTLPNKGLDWLEMFQQSRNLPCLSATQDQENLLIRHKGIRTSHIRQTIKTGHDLTKGLF